VLQKKSGLSQKRDQPILVVVGSQSKNPLADLLDRMREIFQFEVWNSSNFRYYFLILRKIDETIRN